MVNLREYREYWERMAACVECVTGVLPVTVDHQMGKKIQALPKDSVTIFVLPPVAESSAKPPDNYREENKCVIFLFAKYDAQRVDSFTVLEQTQPAIEGIKAEMLRDQAVGCPVMRIDVGSIDIAPETELYAGFAGWSIGFNIKSS